jgi:pyruvate/2-oxoglutarate dehydrogenase complex dihydrolipoamide dehydrogenase (E3) component
MTATGITDSPYTKPYDVVILGSGPSGYTAGRHIHIAC